jgi:hypothetical protein
MTVKINLEDVVKEVTEAFESYERAIRVYDAEAMNRLFWDSPFTLRYGPKGTLMGYQAIAAYRQARQGNGIVRELRNTVITTFGCDFAVANTEGVVGDKIHRQSQTWVRFPEGWRIVAAHVSDEPKA